jgi:hypothetical protein
MPSSRCGKPLSPRTSAGFMASDSVWQVRSSPGQDFRIAGGQFRIAGGQCCVGGALRSQLESGVEVDAGGACLSRGGHAFDAGSPRLCGLDVGLAGGAAGAAACFVALDHLGKQGGVGALGFGVDRAAPVVVVQNPFEVVLGGVLVPTGDRGRSTRRVGLDGRLVQCGVRRERLALTSGRCCRQNSVRQPPPSKMNCTCPSQTSGAKGTRTPDPHTASVVRYQLRHSPEKLCPSKLHHCQEAFKVAGQAP